MSGEVLKLKRKVELPGDPTKFLDGEGNFTSPSATGGLQLIQVIPSLVAAQSQIAFSGLNGDVDLEYIAVFELLFWGNPFAFSLFINGLLDASARTMGAQFSSGDAAPSGVVYTDGRLFQVGAAPIIGKVELRVSADRANGRNINGQMEFTWNIPAANGGWTSVGWSSSVMGAPVSSIGLVAPGAAAIFAAGSKAYLYKRATS